MNNSTNSSAALTFPWPEIRDFISVHISELLAQQNLMVGEQMLKLEAPGTTAEAVEAVREVYKSLAATSQSLNVVIEQRLAALDGRPKILVPAQPSAPAWSPR